MDTIRDWLVLIRAPDLGPAKLRTLLGEGYSPTALIKTGAAALDSLGLSQRCVNSLTAPDWRQADADLENMEKHQIRLLVEPKKFPTLLQQIPGPPLWLFAKGRTKTWDSPLFAVVGSRNPSWLGRELAQDFTAELCKYGLGIVSGLATGVDGESHASALEHGSTIAVCATGLDSVYPKRHQSLAQEIADQGLLISEYPPGTQPTRHQFPQRNRIISGLSLGTLVVEAARRSGSLITARLAAEQGREVFAIPGSLHNPLARGCHRLIRDGAKLVENVIDILEELQSLAQIGPKNTDKTQTINPNRQLKDLPQECGKLLDILSVAPICIDQLVQKSTLTPERVCSMLLRMELAGLVAPAPGGTFIRKA